jgi:hypothetical protein
VFGNDGNLHCRLERANTRVGAIVRCAFEGRDADVMNTTAPGRRYNRQPEIFGAFLCALVLQPSRAARGQLDLRLAQDAHDRGHSGRKLRGIGDGRLRWPLDQDRGGRVGPLD